MGPGMANREEEEEEEDLEKNLAAMVGVDRNNKKD